MLALLLQHCGGTIVSFHEHDSLLDHRVEEELSMEERKEAWREYQLEETKQTNARVHIYTRMPTLVYTNCSQLILVSCFSLAGLRPGFR